MSAGLDPDDLEILIRRAVDEDLDGGVDVTTVATDTKVDYSEFITAAIDSNILL